MRNYEKNASKIDQRSPVVEDFARVVNYDEDGKEYITYEKIDYPAIQKSHGKAEDWSLNALLAAGINPDFSIHTGFSTRLDGVDKLNQFSAMADELLKELEQ